MIYDQFQTDKQAFELVCINGVYQIRVKSIKIWFDALIGKFFWKTLYFSDSLFDTKKAFYMLAKEKGNISYKGQNINLNNEE
jgi:hypothetical protein